MLPETLFSFPLPFYIVVEKLSDLSFFPFCNQGSTEICAKMHAKDVDFFLTIYGGLVIIKDYGPAGPSYLLFDQIGDRIFTRVGFFYPASNQFKAESIQLLKASRSNGFAIALQNPYS